MWFLLHAKGNAPHIFFFGFGGFLRCWSCSPLIRYVPVPSAQQELQLFFAAMNGLQWKKSRWNFSDP